MRILGADIVDAGSKYATEALVLMVVGNFPLLIFNPPTGDEKANIVKKSLDKQHEIDVIITRLTCDCPNTHFTMAEKLGGKVKKIRNLHPFFEHPMNNFKDHIIFDACHMVNLVRHNW
ncbi:hypothetical protein JTB14_004887 [Gonioctena quinquepunctata]|nr:hypothetical protein JTB14_004887 [Gonioctena quinquepunctata]